MVEHACSRKLPLIHHERRTEGDPDDECAEDVRVGPGVWVLRPREADAGEDQSYNEQDVPRPVEQCEFLASGEASLQGAEGRFVAEYTDDA